jgi:undecaprenyl-diphosphatase
MLEALKSIDAQVFLSLNGLHNDFFDFVMFWASERFIWIPFYVFLAYLLFRHYGQRFWILILMAGILITLSDQTSVLLFKQVFHRLRPCHEPSLEGLVHLVNNKCGGKYGFVSSHAVNSFALATYMSLLLGRKIRYFTLMMLLWALLLSYSRIYLGVHYPGDVIVGAIWGAGLGAAIYSVAGFWINRTRMNADYAD